MRSFNFRISISKVIYAKIKIDILTQFTEFSFGKFRKRDKLVNRCRVNIVFRQVKHIAPINIIPSLRSCFKHDTNRVDTHTIYVLNLLDIFFAKVVIPFTSIFIKLIDVVFKIGLYTFHKPIDTIRRNITIIINGKHILNAILTTSNLFIKGTFPSSPSLVNRCSGSI